QAARNGDSARDTTAQLARVVVTSSTPAAVVAYPTATTALLLGPALPFRFYVLRYIKPVLLRRAGGGAIFGIDPAAAQIKSPTPALGRHGGGGRSVEAHALLASVAAEPRACTTWSSVQ